jgi:hypothetical protein
MAGTITPIFRYEEYLLMQGNYTPYRARPSGAHVRTRAFEQLFRGQLLDVYPPDVRSPKYRIVLYSQPKGNSKIRCRASFTRLSNHTPSSCAEALYI